MRSVSTSARTEQPTVCTHHACLPCPNVIKSTDVFTSWCLAPAPAPRSRSRAKRNGSNACASGPYRASSECAVTAAAATSVPRGMRVPSESVTSLTAFRNRFTVRAG